MTRYKYAGYGDETAEMIVYPETSTEEDMMPSFLDKLDSLYHETYESCWEYDGNTECWSGYVIYWDDTFSNKSTNWTDMGDFDNALDSEGYTDEQAVHLGLINDASNMNACGRATGQSPYCNGYRPEATVDMACQSDVDDAVSTAAQEISHCLITTTKQDVQDLTGPDDDEHSLGEFLVDGSDNDRCTPMICGYGGLNCIGTCWGDGSPTGDPHLSFTSCTHYSIAHCEGWCQ